MVMRAYRKTEKGVKKKQGAPANETFGEEGGERWGGKRKRVGRPSGKARSTQKRRAKFFAAAAEGLLRCVE